MPAIFNFIKNSHKKGDQSRLVPSAADMNKVATILQDIQGIGCRIEKPVDRDGKGWHVVVDGSTDIDPPDGSVVHPNKKATASKSGAEIDTTTNDSAGYTFNTDLIETNDAILKVTTSSSEIIVQKGYSGIYRVTIQAKGSLEFTGAGRMFTKIYLQKAGATQPLTWQLTKETHPTNSGSDVDYLDKIDSASQSIFVDASAGDIILDLEYSMDVTGDGSTGKATLRVDAFTVELVELRTSAT